MYKIILYSIIAIFFTTKLSAQEYVTDTRDGQKYKTIVIGDQLWMAENLRYKLEGAVVNPRNPSVQYGYLYTWEAAQKACPAGWRLPAVEDWNRMLLYVKAFAGKGVIVNANIIKSTEGWKSEFGNGNNITGMNIYPAGAYYNDSFSRIGQYTAFHTSTIEDGRIFNYSIFNNRLGEIDKNIFSNKEVRVSCRCIKE